MRRSVWMLTLLVALGATGAAAQDWGEHVPGEIVIQVAREAVPTLDRGDLRVQDPVLGQALAELDIQQAEAVFQGPVNDLMRVHGMDRDYLLRVDESLDIPATCLELEALESVDFAHPNLIARISRIPNDDRYTSKQWYHPLCMAPEGWDINIGNADTVICIADTGAAMTHPDLAGMIWENSLEVGGTAGVDDDANGFIDDFNGWDFRNGDNDPTDDEGHGTHVSGIASAHADNSIGVAGLGWGCRLMICKNMGATGSGTVNNSASAIRYAADNGADVVNMSYGHGSPAAVETNAVNYAWGLGVILVGAAGNDGNQNPGYPGAYDNVITVANTTRSDIMNEGSTHGTFVNVCAPGTGIHSTAWLPPNDLTYKSYDGTSMSSPYVAGLAGLLRAQDPSMDKQVAFDRIVGGAENIDHLNPGLEGLLGNGRVNIFYSLVPTSYTDILELGVADTGPNGLVSGNGRLDSGEAADITLDLVHNPSWKDAESVTIQLVSPVAYVQVEMASVNVGDLDSKEETTPAGHFRVRVDTDAPRDVVVDMEFTIQAADGNRVQTVSMSVNDPDPEMTGWPLDAGGSNILGSVALADLVGGPALEIAVADGDGRFHLLKADGSEVAGWPYDPAGVDETWFAISSPAVGDLDDDGDLEVVGISYRVAPDPLLCEIYAFESNGTVMAGWPKTVNEPIKGSPTLTDLNGDGCLEVLAGGYDYNLYAWDCNGDMYGGWPKNLGTHVFGTAAAGDVDGDGAMEIVATVKDDSDPATYGRVHVMEGDGTELPGWPVDLPGQIYPSPALLDIDHDGTLEIAVACGDYYDEQADNGIYLLEHNGTNVPGWPVTLDSSVYASPAVGDLDRDGQLDIVTITVDARVYAHDATGTILAGFPVDLGAPDVDARCSPVLADVDADGYPEILVGTSSDLGPVAGTGLLHVINHDGSIAHTAFDTGSNGIFPAPAVGDLEGDGELEVVFGDDAGQIHVLDLGAPASTLDWPTFHGDAARTGQYRIGSTGVQLLMPSHYFQPGYDCWLHAVVTNSGPTPLEDHPLFVLLEIFGLYYFAPTFGTDVSSVPGDWPVGSVVYPAIPSFTWPDTGPDVVTGLLAYGALTDPDMTVLVGDLSIWEFGFGP